MKKTLLNAVQQPGRRTIPFRRSAAQDAGRCFNRRVEERFSLTPMYATVEARRPGRHRFDLLEGHAYDISAGGVRIELDQPLEPGEILDLCIHLPGEDVGINATGAVVWMNDADDDPGPRRMAVSFTDFDSPSDRARLVAFLGAGLLTRAA